MQEQYCIMHLTNFNYRLLKNKTAETVVKGHQNLMPNATDKHCDFTCDHMVNILGQGLIFIQGLKLQQKTQNGLFKFPKLHLINIMLQSMALAKLFLLIASIM